MRAAATVLAIAAAVLALAGCSSASPTAAAPSATAAPAVTTSAPPAVVGASLPPAPPVDTWVIKGSDFQQTLDLRLQTKLTETADVLVDDDEARSLAYAVCTSLRTGGTPETARAIIQSAYPTVDQYDTLGILLTAKAFCVDTV